ncbi:MAG: hypothetical protein HKN76_13155, partial [Saprospiraceae bacterium]|nr:hypothetical protein [Saprospiraceae bacterium]
AVVMQDLNQELSSKQAFPEFFESMIEENKLGQKTGEGFYNYEQPKDHLNNFNAFSLEIRDLMLKYNKPSIRIIKEKPSKK